MNKKIKYIPLTLKYIDELILKYREENNNKWPPHSGKINNDGRSWTSVGSWLKKYYNYGLKGRYEILGKEYKEKVKFTDVRKDLLEEWNYSKNIGINPLELLCCRCKRDIWWTCPKCHENYQESISNRIKENRGCPFCCGLRNFKVNNLQNKYPEIAKEFHPTKNNFTASDISPNSNKLVWWKCLKCSGEYKTKVSERTREKCPSNCPHCKLKERSLETRFPNIAKYWHPTLNGDLKPSDIFARSDRKCWWFCDICGESYYSVVNDRIESETFCPYCSGQKVCSWNSLEAKYPKVAELWNKDKNNVSAKDVLPFSHKKAWFDCKKCGHAYNVPIGNVTYSFKKYGGYESCPTCNQFSNEENCRIIIEQFTGKKFPKTKTIPWLRNSKTNYPLEADGYCEELNIIFEYQGPQHYMYHPKFHRNGEFSFFKQLQRDAEKWRLCKENNCLLICLYYNQSFEEITQTIKEFLTAHNIPISEEISNVS